MNNKISNEKVEVPSGIELNDKDYITSCLSYLKSMVKNYAVAVTEASNEVLYQEYKSMLDEFCIKQREVFELMFRRGWYSLEKAEQNKITEKYDCLNNEYNSLDE